MHFDQIPDILAALAGSAVGAFVIAVVIDNALGIANAIKTKTFDVHELPSFVESQFGTHQALALGGLIVAAAITGGDIKQAALSALTAGGGAMTLAVLADAYAKVKELVAPAAALPIPVAPEAIALPHAPGVGVGMTPEAYAALVARQSNPST